MEFQKSENTNDLSVRSEALKKMKEFAALDLVSFISEVSRNKKLALLSMEDKNISMLKKKSGFSVLQTAIGSHEEAGLLLLEKPELAKLPDFFVRPIIFYAAEKHKEVAVKIFLNHPEYLTWKMNDVELTDEEKEMNGWSLNSEARKITLKEHIYSTQGKIDINPKIVEEIKEELTRLLKKL